MVLPKAQAVLESWQPACLDGALEESSSIAIATCIEGADDCVPRSRIGSSHLEALPGTRRRESLLWLLLARADSNPWEDLAVLHRL